MTYRLSADAVEPAGERYRQTARPKAAPPTAPVRMAMELLGQRWMLRAIWELESGALRFLELRHRMDNCSSSVLSERLRQLSGAGLVVKNQVGMWELTGAGAQLGSALAAVWDWAEEGARDRSQSRRGVFGTAVRAHFGANPVARLLDQPQRHPTLPTQHDDPPTT